MEYRSPYYNENKKHINKIHLNKKLNKNIKSSCLLKSNYIIIK